jgi:hypothetical protein
MQKELVFLYLDLQHAASLPYLSASMAKFYFNVFLYVEASINIFIDSSKCIKKSLNQTFPLKNSF